MGSRMVAMILVLECIEVGSNTAVKAAMSGGMNQLVYICYSNGFSIFILFPCVVFYRNRAQPKLTIPTFFKICLLALLSYVLQILFYVGIGYGSPTLASLMMDLTPGFTFLLAIALRMEKLELRAGGGVAKCIGTVVLVMGTLTVTLYKGPSILSTATTHNISLLSSSLLQSNWVIGATLLASAAFCLSLCFIIITWVVKDYPAELNVTISVSLLVTFQSALVALIMEKNVDAWRINSIMELIAIFVTGVVAAALVPVVIGAVVIVFGFYIVIWGRTLDDKDMVGNQEKCSFDSLSSSAVPLLQNKTVDV